MKKLIIVLLLGYACCTSAKNKSKKTPDWVNKTFFYEKINGKLYFSYVEKLSKDNTYIYRMFHKRVSEYLKSELKTVLTNVKLYVPFFDHLYLYDRYKYWLEIYLPPRIEFALNVLSFRYKKDKVEYRKTSIHVNVFYKYVLKEIRSDMIRRFAFDKRVINEFNRFDKERGIIK